MCQENGYGTTVVFPVVCVGNFDSGDLLTTLVKSVHRRESGKTLRRVLSGGGRVERAYRTFPVFLSPPVQW